MLRAWLFPGQGSQYPSMGRSIAALDAPAAVFDVAERVSGLPLRSVMRGGPAELLRRPDYLEPAVVALQIGSAQALRQHGFHPDAVAGYSLGEIAALYCAQSLTLESALTLAAERGKILARHTQEGGWRSVAIRVPQPYIGAPVDASNLAYTACFNSSRDFTLTGREAAVREIEAGLLKGGVSISTVEMDGPWHSPLAEDAARECSALTRRFFFTKPAIPVCLACVGRFEDDPEALKLSLSRSIAAPIHWADAMESLWRKGVRLTLEVGPGRVLTSFVRNDWRERMHLSQFMDRDGGRVIDFAALRAGQAAFSAAIAAQMREKENRWNLSA